MKKTISLLLVVCLLAFVGCSSQQLVEVDSSNTVETYKLGSIIPLSGDGAVYGPPAQAAYQQALADLNAKWEGSNKKMEIIYEDGKCNARDGLLAAQNLVNVHKVSMILGGSCSGETLGLAPFANREKIVTLSSLSSSPEVSEAGDYIFRVVPSDDAQAVAVTEFILTKNVKTVSMLSENTDYAQALRAEYKKLFEKNGITIVVDEVVVPEAREVRSEVAKIAQSNADAVIVLPQTLPTAKIFASQLIQSNIDAMFFANDVITITGDKELYGLIENWYGPRSIFKNENDTKYQSLIEEGKCNLGSYCASIYDSVIMMGDAIDACGKDTECVKEYLYNIKDWEGISGTLTMDENGDVGGSYEIVQIISATPITVRG